MAPDCPDFEALCEFALQYLVTARGDARALAVTLVQRHPDLPVLEIVLILSTAASGLETNFSDDTARSLAVDAWRISALLAVDLHLMAEIGTQGRRAADLMDYWLEEDDFFLRR